MEQLALHYRQELPSYQKLLDQMISYTFVTSPLSSPKDSSNSDLDHLDRISDDPTESSIVHHGKLSEDMTRLIKISRNNISNESLLQRNTIREKLLSLYEQRNRMHQVTYFYGRFYISFIRCISFI